MENAQLRTMFALTVVGLALGAVAWFWEPTEEPLDPDATEEVWSVSADEIVRVEIRRKGDTVVVSKGSGDEWRVDAPWTGVADPDTIHDLVDALVEVERGVPVDGAVDRVEFGLGDPPTAYVLVTDLEGAVTSATFGDEAPVGYRTYALSAAGAVVAIGGRPGRSLLAKSSDFKDRRVFHVDPGAVRRVTIESAEGRLSVSGEKKIWWLEGFSRADPDRVEELILGLLNVRIDEFLDLSDTITEPAIVVEIELADGTVSPIKVGDPTPLGVLVEYEGGFGTVFPESLRLLVQGPTDIGDRRAFPVNPDRTHEVSITRGNETWKADQAGIEGIANAVMHYRREPVPAISEVWATVVIGSMDGVATIDVGQLDGVDFRVVQDRAGGEPYLVPVMDLGLLSDTR